MEFDTFLEMQRARVRQVDRTELDARVRKLRFTNAQPEKTNNESPYGCGLGGYDPIRAGYRRSRLLYE